LYDLEANEWIREMSLRHSLGAEPTAYLTVHVQCSDRAKQALENLAVALLTKHDGLMDYREAGPARTVVWTSEAIRASAPSGTL
jgi:hypothetical protein